MQKSMWREKWTRAVQSPDDMVHFVEEVGCCTSNELPGYPEFPYQSAVIGDVTAGVPDPWFWKDDLHTEKRLYYTRVFGGQPGFIANALLPVLLMTNGAVADELIFTGGMSLETQEIYRLIERLGPISIKDMKRQLAPDALHGVSRVLHELDRQFIITKTGITGRVRSTYGYIWDLVERWMPDILVAADQLGRAPAKAIMNDQLAAFGILPDSPFYRKVMRWE